jgi:UDP-GlcNAc:undecaprenyl-phosphate GlcNAc-1-phosphate transferase
MYGGFLVAFAVAALMDSFDPLFARNSEPRGRRASPTVIIISVGLWDDIKGLSRTGQGHRHCHRRARPRLVRRHDVLLPHPVRGVYVLSDDWIPLITVLWLLGMTQAINLIDGLDGLAAASSPSAPARSSSTPSASPTSIC